MKHHTGTASVHTGRSWRCILALVVACSLFFLSCTTEDDTVRTVPARHWVEKTVAVVAPLSDASQKTRLERTAEWFADNYRRAQQHDTLAVSLSIEWHDEQTEDLTALSSSLASRDDIMAVIGPFDNDALAAFAPACQKTLKPLITPTASSEEIIRRYAVKNSNGITSARPFLWALTESDVKLTEALMSTYAALCQTKKDRLTANAHLLSPNNSYGQTFAYWAPFFAENYDIDLIDNVQYASQEELADYLRSYIYTSGTAGSENFISGLFTVIESTSQLYDVALLRRQLIFDRLSLDKVYHTTYDDPAMDAYWQIFESAYGTYFALNNLCDEKIEALGERAWSILQGYSGFSPYADPTTGFELSYLNRFGVRPTFAECKFYDALMLAGFAACYVEHHTAVATNAQFNQAIIDITNGAEKDAALSGAAWSATSMEIYLSAMERGSLLHFKGASGDIAFDPETFTTTTRTTYVQWQILERQIRHRAYIGGTGSRRIGGSYAAWQYLYDRNAAEADFDEQTGGAAEYHYPALSDQYAVLVQGSHGFSNYRHLSDVLSVYQLLRRNGYPDDHILLIADKTMPAGAMNPEQGVIRASAGGADLLGGTDGLPPATIDYDNAALTAADIGNILMGIPSDRTPTVLPRDGLQNVLFYWSGHGRTGEFVWRDTPNGQGFGTKRLQQTALTMLDTQTPTCRKLLVVVEPCYGEGVLAGLSGITGALGISGANASEQSWADNYLTRGGRLMDDSPSRRVVVFTVNEAAYSDFLFIACEDGNDWDYRDRVFWINQTTSYISTVAPAPTIVLTTDADNSSVLTENGGQTRNVTLSGRTLYRNNEWNTFCLPFPLSAAQLANNSCPLKGATVMTLSDTSFDAGTLTLNFTAADAIVAGQPYLVKWDDGTNVTNPTFWDVTISTAPASTVIAGKVSFTGCYSPVTLPANDRSVLYLGAANMLYYPTVDIRLGACRAYFQLDGITAREASQQEVRAFRLNFGGEASGITEVAAESTAVPSLHGLLPKGISIRNGKKFFSK